MLVLLLLLGGATAGAGQERGKSASDHQSPSGREYAFAPDSASVRQKYSGRERASASEKSSARENAAVGTVTVDTTRVINQFDPDRALGSSMDVLSKRDIDLVYTPHIVQEALGAGWGPITYRNNTELRMAAWHWNENGTWSDAAHKSGYFTGSTELKEPTRYILAYALPHRGFSTSGDAPVAGPNLTEWKSNPYLTERFTGEGDAQHPQWVVVDLKAVHLVNAVKIAWASPWAVAYRVEYWVQGKEALHAKSEPVDTSAKPGDALDFDRGPAGEWKTFAGGVVRTGKGGVVVLKVGRSAGGRAALNARSRILADEVDRGTQGLGSDGAEGKLLTAKDAKGAQRSRRKANLVRVSSSQVSGTERRSLSSAGPRAALTSPSTSGSEDKSSSEKQILRFAQDDNGSGQILRFAQDDKQEKKELDGVETQFVRVWMTESSNTCDEHGSKDVRNCVGYAIKEIHVGTVDGAGNFVDVMQMDAMQSSSGGTGTSSDSANATGADAGIAPPNSGASAAGANAAISTPNSGTSAAGANVGTAAANAGTSAQIQPSFTSSSIDPWHEATDVNDSGKYQHTGFDLFFTSGITNGLPAMIPVTMLYGTPEDSAAQLEYIEKRGYPVAYVEMGEEPDGKHMLPEDYGALYLQWATALHRVDPHLRLGGPVFEGVTEDIRVWPDSRGRVSWMGRFVDYLKTHGRISDLAFVSFEHYPYEPCAVTWKSLYDEPRLMKHTLDVWRKDGVPDVPLMVTESHLAPYLTGPMSTMFAGLWLADNVGSFFEGGGTAFYHSPIQPQPVEPSCEGWATWSNFVADKDYNITGYTSLYFVAQLINREWAQHRSGVHQMYRVTTDVKDGDGNELVTAYALRRPDGNWSVMLVNRDEANAHTVRVNFEGAGGAPGYFAGPVHMVSFGSEQYGWKDEGLQSHADPDGPVAAMTMTGGSRGVVTLPRASVSVVRGGVQ